MISRNGNTLDLGHDTSDNLTNVKNETTGEQIGYTYDGQGHRVEAKEGTTERQFLVAKYANKYQSLPFALYITFKRVFGNQTLADDQLATETVNAEKNAFTRGVVLYLLKIYD